MFPAGSVSYTHLMLFDLEEAIMFTPKPQEYTDPLTGEMKKKQMKFFPDAYKTVSYTHLDVYKRQLLHNPPLAAGHLYPAFKGRFEKRKRR